MHAAARPGMTILTLAALLLPVFGTVFAGWTLARVTALPAWLAAGIQRLTFDLLLPLLLFHTMATVPLREQFDVNLLLAYYLPTLALYGAVLGIVRRRGRTLREANVLALASTYGNAVLLGVPLILHAWGDAAAVPLFAIVGLHSAVMFFLTSLVHELAADGLQLRTLLVDTLARLLRNPILIGLLAGTLVNLLGARLPAPVFAVTAMVRDLAPWIALVAMGIGLASHDMRGAVADSTAVLACKLVLHPLAVALACAVLLGTDTLTTRVLVTIAALPPGINVYLFAVRFRAGEAASATSIVLGTVASLLALGAVLLLLGNGTR